MKHLKVQWLLLLVYLHLHLFEVSVSGSMQATYQNEVDDVTGNP